MLSKSGAKVRLFSEPTKQFPEKIQKKFTLYNTLAVSEFLHSFSPAAGPE